MSMFSDAALRDVTIVQRPASGNVRSSGSARRKLLSSFSLTRSFVGDQTSGKKHMTAASRCSSLPAYSKTSLTGVAAVGSLTNLGVASSATGGGRGAALTSSELQPMTASAAGPSLQLAEILAAEDEMKLDVSQSVNSLRVARDVQFSEAVGKLKLIPLALPGDDQRLQHLNSVSAVF